MLENGIILEKSNKVAPLCKENQVFNIELNKNSNLEKENTYIIMDDRVNEQFGKVC